jgi:uncharacterized protein YbaR (Trm112 family)
MDAKLLEILGNPLLPERPPLRQQGNYLICTVSGTGFPILDGIPQLLPENAIPAEEMDKLLSHE